MAADGSPSKDANDALHAAGLTREDLRRELTVAPDAVTLRDLWEMSKDNRDAVASAARDNQFAINQMKEGIDARFDAQGSRIDVLIQTTNHRMQNFESLLEARRVEFNTRIGQITANSVGAVSAPQLASVLLSQLSRSRLVWLLLAVPVLVFAPVVFDHWAYLYERIFHFLGNLPF